jgi:hypothetical protein
MRTSRQQFVLCPAITALLACGAPDGSTRLLGNRNGTATSSRTNTTATTPAAGSGNTPTIAGTGGPLVNAPPPIANNQDKVCASAIVQTANVPPTVYFVIDGSGSMCADFGSVSRWQALRSALLDPTNGLMQRLQAQVKFGITLYDGTVNQALSMVALATGGSGTPACAIAASRAKMFGECPGLVESAAPELNNAMAIAAIYPDRELGGSTPTDRALGPVMDRLIPMVGMQAPDGAPVGDIYVILATDGAPNDICTGGVGGDGSAQRQAVVAAVDRGAAAGITTWVISLAGDDAALQAHLDEVAKHGEPANPNARTLNPTNPDELIMTLAQLLGGAVGCNITLSGKVKIGQECQGTVEQNSGALPCCQQGAAGEWTCAGAATDAPNGWRLASESSVELLGESCTNFLLGSGDVLHAQFPCEVFTPD